MPPGKIKYVVIGLGVVIVALFGVLVFVPSAHSPTVKVRQSPPVPPTAIMVEPAMSPDKHVEVGAPTADETVSSPLRISGNVTGGGWFFEGSFPVKITDGNGAVLGEGSVQAIGDWTSTGTVLFAAAIPFTPPRFATGMIVLSKDNPSGDPKNAESFSIPVRFAMPAPVAATTTKPALPIQSGVRGTVTIGPTCPVERIPPTPFCAPRPYQTSIVISRNIATSVALMTVKSDASGTFTAVLDPGQYVLQPQGGSPLPRCGGTPVTVTAQTFSDVTLICDSGIR
jgi:hypothetical protein